MRNETKSKKPITLTGKDRTTFSLFICLHTAGHAVTLQTDRPENAWAYIRSNAPALASAPLEATGSRIVSDGNIDSDTHLALVITAENPVLKQQILRKLDAMLPENSIIAVNSETIPLSQLQAGLRFPERLLIANWTEPVHTTFFLELVANKTTREVYTDYLQTLARRSWKKDPYLVKGETGIRSLLLAALLREAFYLVGNGFATVEDIDRACRNDAGYYLPFAGNLRYMDLMGTYAYGLVMKDLNPELATDPAPPPFFREMLQKGEAGMETSQGFYAYQPGEPGKWEALVTTFSEEIRHLMQKYPFDLQEKVVEPIPNPL